MSNDQNDAGELAMDDRFAQIEQEVRQKYSVDAAQSNKDELLEQATQELVDLKSEYEEL